MTLISIVEFSGMPDIVARKHPKHRIVDKNQVIWIFFPSSYNKLILF